jgi:excisionase family DNA binding protein
MQKLLTVRESAGRLGLAEITLRTWIAARKVTVVRLGRAIRVSERELDRLIERGTQPSIERR